MTALNIVRDSIFGYIAWTGIHWLTSNLYVQSCTPVGWMGFLQTFYNSQSIFCNSMRWLSQTSGQNMDGAFVVLTSWCVARIASSKVSPLVRTLNPVSQ